MAETVKKTKAPAKPKSAASRTKEVTEQTTLSAVPEKPKAPAKSAKAKETKVAAAPAASAANGRGIHLEEKAPAPTREQIAQLAHRFWKERGGHHGSHEQDWLRAERELRGMAS